MAAERGRTEGLLAVKDAHIRDLADQLVELRNDLIDEQAKEAARLRRERDEAREERDRLAVMCEYRLVNAPAAYEAARALMDERDARIRADAWDEGSATALSEAEACSGGIFNRPAVYDLNPFRALANRKDGEE